MIDFAKLVFVSLVLMILGALADAEPAKPLLQESMPLKAAQDLDYAMLRKQRTAQKLFEKYKKLLNEELKTATKDETDLIERLEKQYSIKVVDEQGQPYDVVDPDTGKITRKNPPAPAPSPAPKSR